MGPTLVVFVFTLSIYLVSSTIMNSAWTSTQVNQFKGQVAASLFNKVYGDTLQNQPIVFVCGSTDHGKVGLYAAVYLTKVHSYKGIEVFYKSPEVADDILLNLVNTTLNTKDMSDSGANLKARLGNGDIALVADFFYGNKFEKALKEDETYIEALNFASVNAMKYFAMELVSTMPLEEGGAYPWDDQSFQKKFDVHQVNTFFSVDEIKQCNGEAAGITANNHFLIKSQFPEDGPKAAKFVYYPNSRLPNFMTEYMSIFTVSKVSNGIPVLYKWTEKAGWPTV